MKVGDTVRLKSGGPVMTITAITGDDVACMWFDKPGENVYKRDFRDCCLEEATNPWNKRP